MEDRVLSKRIFDLREAAASLAGGELRGAGGTGRLLPGVFQTGAGGGRGVYRVGRAQPAGLESSSPLEPVDPVDPWPRVSMLLGEDRVIGKYGFWALGVLVCGFGVLGLGFCV